MTLTEHARLTLRRQIEKLESQLALALQDPGEDPVHDFRVAIRRLSQSFRIFATLFPQRDARRYRQRDPHHYAGGAHPYGGKPKLCV